MNLLSFISKLHQEVRKFNLLIKFLLLILTFLVLVPLVEDLTNWTSYENSSRNDPINMEIKINRKVFTSEVGEIIGVAFLLTQMVSNHQIYYKCIFICYFRIVKIFHNQKLI